MGIFGWTEDLCAWMDTDGGYTIKGCLRTRPQGAFDLSLLRQNQSKGASAACSGWSVLAICASVLRDILAVCATSSQLTAG